ncbi:ComF family protein [Bowmanella sp. Y26]|uniref:ComF family protein n=1 Tax=Bowmanella yangjiangensis TaxID=2811230 RepID=UPI001BDCC696|nr:phosphoribosyltransferase family protein [Bowmanella yangjiangensis]MBT1065820.1 ComF family protein [Bowmanella yangjiangensis]
MAGMLKTIGFKIPQSCLLCQQPADALICHYCQTDLPVLALSQCDYNLLNWPKIKSGLQQVAYDSLLVSTEYCWPWDKLLTALKFNQRTLCAKALAEQFYRIALTHNGKRPEAILPMPLHYKRYAKRKYNQTMEIAKHLSALSGIALDDQLCQRSKATQAQTQLSGAQRRKNLRDAFRLSSPPAYQHVAILDDIIATGSTVNSLSKALKKAKPSLHIEVWAIAISLSPGTSN